MSLLESIINAAGMAVLGLTAAAQLYHAWRAFDDATAGGEGAAGGRRRQQAATARGGWRAVRRGREVRILTPSGETALVFLGSSSALEQLGLLGPDGSLLGGDGPDGGVPVDPAAARVAAMAGSGREFGPDDYEELSALDAGIRHRRGGGGWGPRVTAGDVDRLPTHAHRPASAAVAVAAAGPSPGDGGGPEADADAPPACPVCLAPFEAGECVRTLPCVHNFHAECVDPWLLSHGRCDAACPVCKTPVFEGM